MLRNPTCVRHNGGVLIYDGDCGFCTRCAHWLQRQLRTPIAVVPWQEINDLGELELGTEDVRTAVYWVDTYGRHHRGHAAVARCLLMSGRPWPAAGALMLLPPINVLAALVYSVVARNRHRLPGATEGCRLPERVSFVPSSASAGGPAGS